jgi:hypothetical protein
MRFRAAAALLLAVLAPTHAVAQCVYSTPGATGCGPSSPFWIPMISCNGAPSIGNPTFGVTTSTPCIGTPNAGLLLVGACLPAPIQFTSGPATGLCVAEAFCALYLDPCVVLMGTLSSGGFTYSLPVPNNPLFVGIQLCMQGVHTCTGMSCVGATNNVRVTVF